MRSFEFCQRRFCIPVLCRGVAKRDLESSQHPSHLEMSESAVNFRARWFTNPEAWILLTAVLAFVLKFDLAFRTFGTNDVAIFYKLIVFFIFPPAVSAQYLVWLAPFVLALSPSLFWHLLWSSSLFLFFFYKILAHGLPRYPAISTVAANTVWTRWSLLPWAVLIVGAILIWESARRDNPSFRLLSLQAVKSKEPA
jgi:hypothetical protein